MELPQYYELLKVEDGADLDTIKKAFRREIALYHPEKNSSENARQHFEKLVEAFDILSHPDKRRAYDDWLKQQANNKPVVIAQKQESQYQDWKKEAKKKSDTFWNSDLADLLVLDLFLDAGLSSLFSGADGLLDGIGDSLGDIFDIF
ncbi:J domain-containing protein [Psychroserpens sp. XS_ASV72]|uniref:J domain-containing protein n=1 Tax=Psychroserpens sp. XS_ASV72 TaxID=3241293 RepID=UPI003513FE35